MERIVVRVPAKITLFGEHAVVYGYPAIAASIPRYVIIEAVPSERNRVLFLGSDIRVPIRSADIEGLGAEVRRESVERVVSYVARALAVCSEQVGGLDGGLELRIESELPPSIGLGTSAAVSAGVLAACMAMHGVEIEASELAKLAWRVEREVQGAASPMDTATVCLGGVRLIDPKSLRHELLRESIDALVGYVPRAGTTASLVAYVKRLREAAPEVVEDVMKAIARVVEMGVEAVRRGDLETLGLLANVNHGLLHALGVVSEDSDRVIHALRKAGAYGAKMSGAGGGGAFIAFSRPDALPILAEVAKAMGARVVSLKAGGGGIVVERR